MSQEESSTTQSSRRSRPAANRGQQPTVAQLARLGIKVRDFAYESTLPPVRTVYRQPRQIQPGVVRQLQREDTEPLDGSQSSQPWDTVENKGPAIERGFFEVDRNVNSQPFRIHPETTEYSQAIQPLIASQETGMLVPTPTVTPNGSLQWKEPQAFSGHDTPSPKMLSRHTSNPHPSLSGFSSPLTPLPSSPPSRQGSSALIIRSPSMASLDKPSPKRRKISIDNINSRPGMKRYYLRKRPLSSSNHFHSARTPAPPLSRTVSVRSDHLRRKKDAECPLHMDGGTSKGRSGRRRS